MKIFNLFVLLAILAIPFFAVDVKTGEDVVVAMHKKYAGKWYKTLTFVQKTITHKPDGTDSVETWYEAMEVPGKLRIDIVPTEKGNGVIFANGKIHSYRDGKLAGSRPFVHPLLVLGFDVYGQPAETTVGQLRSLGIDMATVHEGKWQGRDVYVVGAKPGDLSVPQFWIDKKDLLFVRLIQLGGRDKKVVQETQFNKYVKVKGGGWVAVEVKFFNDGKPTMTEEYTDVQGGVKLTGDLWDPEKWMTVDKTYYKKQ